jgi:hypothetical protein
MSYISVSALLKIKVSAFLKFSSKRKLQSSGLFSDDARTVESGAGAAGSVPSGT